MEKLSLKLKNKSNQIRPHLRFLILLTALQNSQTYLPIRMWQNNQKMIQVKIGLEQAKLPKKMHQRNQVKLNLRLVDRFLGQKLSQVRQVR